MKKILLFLSLSLIAFLGCKQDKDFKSKKYSELDFGNYVLAEVPLNYDLSYFPESKKNVIAFLIKAAAYADSMFLYESAGEYAKLRDRLKDSMDILRFDINFGPWDRFNNNRPFLAGVGDKPLGANFYPRDMIVEEFIQFRDNCKFSYYTFLRRDSLGGLYCVPYNEQFRSWIEQVNKYLDLAIYNCEDSSFANYLKSLQQALLLDDYYSSDSLWLSLDTKIDFVFGPKVIREDKLLSLKAEHIALVLIKDEQWSKKMESYNHWLKYLQKALPVPDKYKQEEPGKGSIIRVYDVIFYGGSAHAGAVDISTVLPFNPRFQVAEGVKNLQFKNIIEAKFEAILQPMAEQVFVPSQRKYVTKEAFFINTLMYEMANSLGIRNTVSGKGTVRQALREYYTIIDMIKNNVLVLYLVEQLYSVGEIPGDLKQYYFTFVLNMIRKIRWGVDNDYALASLVIFNYLHKHKAISYLPTGEIILHYDAMKSTIEQLIKEVLILQGEGDYIKAARLILSNKTISQELQNIINKVNQSRVPIDIYVKQGLDLLKLH